MYSAHTVPRLHLLLQVLILLSYPIYCVDGFNVEVLSRRCHNISRRTNDCCLRALGVPKEGDSSSKDALRGPLRGPSSSTSGSTISGSSSSSSSSSSNDRQTQTQTTQTISTSSYLNAQPIQPILFVPLLAPIVSFLFYTPIASVFRTLLDLLTEITGGKTWIPVDGGAYQIEILTPSINGIVLPSLCILFATLVSTTITQLRDRQLSVRQASEGVRGVRVRELERERESASLSTNTAPINTDIAVFEHGGGGPVPFVNTPHGDGQGERGG